MATTKQIAEQLRKVAEHMESLPEEEIGHWMLTNSYTSDGELFKRQVRAVPRPLTKNIRDWSGGSDIVLESDNKGLRVYLSIDRASVCRVVKPAQPAVYECEPIFSPEEEAELQ